MGYFGEKMKKEHNVIFEELANELGRDTFRRRVASRLSPYKSLFFLLLVVVVGVGCYTGYIAYERRPFSRSETNGYLKKTLDLEKGTFTWTKEAVLDLALSEKGKKGISLDEVIQKYGNKVDDYWVSDDSKSNPGIFVRYLRKKAPDMVDYVLLEFKREDGVFRLVNKGGTFSSSKYMVEAKKDYRYVWTDQDIEKLEDTEEVSPEDIVKKYGKASSATYQVDRYSKQHKLFLIYEKSEKEMLALDFIQEGGEYRLNFHGILPKTTLDTGDKND